MTIASILGCRSSLRRLVDGQFGMFTLNSAKALGVPANDPRFKRRGHQFEYHEVAAATPTVVLRRLARARWRARPHELPGGVGAAGQLGGRHWAGGAFVICNYATVLEGEFAGVPAGIQAWRTLPGRLGEIPLKTYPSGGARHPLELYVLARDVRGLARGLYHYAADRHVLERLPARVGRRRVQDYLPRQYWFDAAGVVVFFTAVFARTRWRYRFGRAYRAILAEAGHACQTFCLVATRLGLAPFCSMALADSRIEADLGIDGISESVLYAAGAGLRPASEQAGSSPPDLPARRVRPNPALRRGRGPGEAPN